MSEAILEGTPELTSKLRSIKRSRPVTDPQSLSYYFKGHPLSAASLHILICARTLLWCQSSEDHSWVRTAQGRVQQQGLVLAVLILQD